MSKPIKPKSSWDDYMRTEGYKFYDNPPVPNPNEGETPMSPYRTGPLQQTCPKCGKVFDFPEMCSVTQCPHCGELQEPQ